MSRKMGEREMMRLTGKIRLWMKLHPDQQPLSPERCKRCPYNSTDACAERGTLKLDGMNLFVDKNTVNGDIKCVEWIKHV